MAFDRHIHPLRYLPEILPAHEPDWQACRITAVFVRLFTVKSAANKEYYFTTTFFHHPDELREEVREAGFSVETILAIEGAAVFLQDLDEQWKDTGRRERILDAVHWLEDEPPVIGVTGHIIAVATKVR